MKAQDPHPAQGATRTGHRRERPQGNWELSPNSSSLGDAARPAGALGVQEKCRQVGEGSLQVSRRWGGKRRPHQPPTPPVPPGSHPSLGPSASGCCPQQQPGPLHKQPLSQDDLRLAHKPLSKDGSFIFPSPVLRSSGSIVTV